MTHHNSYSTSRTMEDAKEPSLELLIIHTPTILSFGNGNGGRYQGVQANIHHAAERGAPQITHEIWWQEFRVQEQIPIGSSRVARGNYRFNERPSSI